MRLIIILLDRICQHYDEEGDGTSGSDVGCTMVLITINHYPLEGTTHHSNPLAVHGLESNEAMFYILSEVDLHAQTM